MPEEATPKRIDLGACLARLYDSFLSVQAFICIEPDICLGCSVKISP